MELWKPRDEFFFFFFFLAFYPWKQIRTFHSGLSLTGSPSAKCRTTCPPLAAAICARSHSRHPMGGQASNSPARSGGPCILSQGPRAHSWTFPLGAGNCHFYWLWTKTSSCWRRNTRKFCTSGLCRIVIFHLHLLQQGRLWSGVGCALSESVMDSLPPHLCEKVLCWTSRQKLYVCLVQIYLKNPVLLEHLSFIHSLDVSLSTAMIATKTCRRRGRSSQRTLWLWHRTRHKWHFTFCQGWLQLVPGHEVQGVQIGRVPWLVCLSKQCSFHLSHTLWQCPLTNTRCVHRCFVLDELAVPYPVVSIATVQSHEELLHVNQKYCWSDFSCPLKASHQEQPCDTKTPSTIRPSL